MNRLEDKEEIRKLRIKCLEHDGSMLTLLQLLKIRDHDIKELNRKVRWLTAENAILRRRLQ